MLSLINKKKFLNEIERRKHSSIFDFELLSKPLPYYPYNIIVDNNLYGLAYSINKYQGLSGYRKLNFFFEHGYFFGDYVSKNSGIYNNKGVITFGVKRKKKIEKSKIETNGVICIGPYIHYASSMLNKMEKRSLKSELGTTLLVFPSHSIPGVVVENSIERLIKVIEEEKKQLELDSVLISLYWLDAMDKKLVYKYEEQGYRVVCSGHKFDPHFLDRQRSLIELSNYTISNAVGTHVAYCIYLKKPHKIVKMDSNIKGGQKILLKKENISKTLLDSELLDKTIISDLCRNYYLPKGDNNGIIEEFFGFKSVKNVEELNAKLN